MDTFIVAADKIMAWFSGQGFGCFVCGATIAVTAFIAYVLECLTHNRHTQGA